MNKLISFS